ncbi:MAG: hypothetical protein AAFU78_10075 [Cyanobacteria bacterium J06633_2]
MTQPSSRTLDFCLLAICSCALSLLCHQPIANPVATASSSMPGSMQTATPVSIDFLVKAGLLTTQKDDDDEPIQES